MSYVLRVCHTLSDSAKNCTAVALIKNISGVRQISPKVIEPWKDGPLHCPISYLSAISCDKRDSAEHPLSFLCLFSGQKTSTFLRPPSDMSVVTLRLCLSLCFILNLGKLTALKIHNDELMRYLENNEILGQDVCYTPECHATAADLKASLNTSVNPCDNFYEFACGGWIEKHPVPPTESRWNQFDVVMMKLSLQLKDILELPDEPDDPSPVRSARQSYCACMDVERVEAEGLKPLVTLLNRFGGWPMTLSRWSHHGFHWQTMVAELTRWYGVTPIIFIYVSPDRKNSNISSIVVDQPSFVLPRSMLTDHVLYKKHIEGYVHWITQSALLTAQALGENVTEEAIRKDVVDLVNFEIHLAKISAPTEMRRNANRTYNPMTLRQLQKWTDTAATALPMIDWLHLVNDLFQNTGLTFEYSENVVVREMDFLFNLVNLLEQTNIRVIANYLHWRFVKVVSRDLNSKISLLSFEFDKIFSGATEDQPRWLDCVTSTSSLWSFAVGYKYVKHHFNNEAKNSALEMVGNLRSEFLEQISVISWMDKNTQLAAKEKLETMTQFIGYPHWYNNQSYLENYYKDLKAGPSHFQNVAEAKYHSVMRLLKKLREPIDRYDWPTSPATVNAFYNLQMNSIIFPAGILQPPFFSKGRPEALNYGGIGVVIGHEITHGFDDMGRQSDSMGNLAQWWSDQTLDTYLAKTKCFINQYNLFKVPELNELLLKTVFMNGVTTLGENMADNGGLHQAYLAYKRYVHNNGPEKRLPGLEQFSPDQLFFIAFARNWCESSTKESLLQEVISDPHSPHRFRVQGTVANSPEFATAFNCPIDSPMNPQEKCTFW